MYIQILMALLTTFLWHYKHFGKINIFKLMKRDYKDFWHKEELLLTLEFVSLGKFKQNLSESYFKVITLTKSALNYMNYDKIIMKIYFFIQSNTSSIG